MDSGANDGSVAARVREHLQPGETFRAAVWVSRSNGSPVRVTRAEMSPFRFRRPASDRTGTRRGLHGPPRSLAVRLNEHIRTVTEPRILARTDRRLLVLSQATGSWRTLFSGPPSGDLRPLRQRWECPREELASATEEGGRLRLDFTDGSAVVLLTPTAHVQPFLAG